MGQTYPIYACAGTHNACHFIGSRHTLLKLERRVFKLTLAKDNRSFSPLQYRVLGIRARLIS